MLNHWYTISYWILNKKILSWVLLYFPLYSQNNWGLERLSNPNLGHLGRNSGRKCLQQDLKPALVPRDPTLIHHVPQVIVQDYVELMGGLGGEVWWWWKWALDNSWKMSRCPLGDWERGCASDKGSLMSKGAVWQAREPRGRRVGKTANTERGRPSGPAENLDLLLQGKSCHLSVSLPSLVQQDPLALSTHMVL